MKRDWFFKVALAISLSTAVGIMIILVIVFLGIMIFLALWVVRTSSIGVFRFLASIYRDNPPGQDMA